MFHEQSTAWSYGAVARLSRYIRLDGESACELASIEPDEIGKEMRMTFHFTCASLTLFPACRQPRGWMLVEPLWEVSELRRALKLRLDLRKHVAYRHRNKMREIANDR